MQGNISLTVFIYHITYAFQSEPTLYGYLNVKELLARNRTNTWNLSDYNGTQIYNRLIRKLTLTHLAKLAIYLNGWSVLWVLIWEAHLTVVTSSKWLSVCLRPKSLWVQVRLQSLKREFRLWIETEPPFSSNL